MNIRFMSLMPCLKDIKPSAKLFGSAISRVSSLTNATQRGETLRYSRQSLLRCGKTVDAEPIGAPRLPDERDRLPLALATTDGESRADESHAGRGDDDERRPSRKRS